LNLPVDAVEWTGWLLSLIVVRFGVLRINPLQAKNTHQPRDYAAGNQDVFPAQLTPDLPHAVDTKVLRENAQDLGLQDLVTFALGGSALWVASFSKSLMVG